MQPAADYMIDLPIVEGADAQADQQSKYKFWRSPAQYHEDPDFQQRASREFLPGADEPADLSSGATRRQFLQLSGALLAMTGLSACRRPVEVIVPYTLKPEEVIPGIPLYYATAMPFRGVVRGLLVESHEGRPTKVEGNPQHPLTQGAASAFEQASVLQLYDPDRSKQVRGPEGTSTWAEFVRFASGLAFSPDQSVVVMMEETSSPTVARLRQQLQARYPNLEWITYSAEGDDPALFGAQQLAGRPLRPFYDFEQASVIVSFDGNFLSPTEPNFVQNTRSFARSRKLNAPGDTMSRLYVMESQYSITGGQADHRLRLKASEIPQFAVAVAARLGVGGGPTPFDDHPFVAAIADDLRAAGSGGVLVAGDTQPPEVHALCLAVNAALGSGAVRMLDTGETQPRAPQAAAVAGLVERMAAGQVDTLITIGVNPVGNAPAELAFGEAMRQVPNTINLGLYRDETAEASRWHVPRAHYLEQWGDGRAYDGTLSVIQPLIRPLYEDTTLLEDGAGKSEVEFLGVLATGLDAAGYDLVRETWQGVIGGDFASVWRETLHDGYLPGTGYPTVPVPGGAPPAVPTPQTAGELEVVFRLDPTLLDGSYANLAWMQELPDPITKIVWDNVAQMSRRTAEALGLSVDYDEGVYSVSTIGLTVNGQATVLPVWVVPGHPDGSITVNLGYGGALVTDRELVEYRLWNTDRTTDIYNLGPIQNEIGVNVAPLRSPLFERVSTVGVAVEATGDDYEIVTTQEHGAMEGRPIVRVADYGDYVENPDFAADKSHMVPGVPEESYAEYPELWEDHPSEQAATKDNPYYKNQWGMVIDLNTCTGCNACVTACDSENNIPAVGKEQVGLGREMHWMRIDRYYASPADFRLLDVGTELLEEAGRSEAGEARVDVEGEAYDDNPVMVVQPVLCMHCENAPCESVCPVAATVHSPDGTNQMIYNRCIGTRYCSNNCPYKVRRYNWYNWTKTTPLQLQMGMNPNVTVRYRGVMEKCSYCIQRIREVGKRANVEERAIKDGEVLTACQQTCPAEAIMFGDLNDPSSQVNEWKLNPRRYEMLDYLNVKPRTSYLGRVRNPNPALAGPLV